MWDYATAGAGLEVWSSSEERLNNKVFFIFLKKEEQP